MDRSERGRKVNRLFCGRRTLLFVAASFSSCSLYLLGHLRTIGLLSLI